MFVSVIIPAYNEEARLETTLNATYDYLTSHFPDSFELLIIDDGSTDQTPTVAADFAMQHKFCHVLSYGCNRGKGFAVRYGMLRAAGSWRLFCDADLATPIDEFGLLYQALENDQSDIAIGSRPLANSHLLVRQPWYREKLGRGFNLLVQMLSVKGIHDTQCGFKIFSARAAEDVFSRSKIDGYIFDAEALYLANRLGYAISEVPIRWSHKDGSKVSLVRDGIKMIIDLLKIRRLHRTLQQSPMQRPLSGKHS